MKRVKCPLAKRVEAGAEIRDEDGSADRGGDTERYQRNHKAPKRADPHCYDGGGVNSCRTDSF